MVDCDRRANRAVCRLRSMAGNSRHSPPNGIGWCAVEKSGTDNHHGGRTRPCPHASASTWPKSPSPRGPTSDPVGTRRRTDRRRSTVGCRRRDAGLDLHLLQAFAQPLHDFPWWALAQVAEHMLRRGRRWMVQENVSAYRVRVACRVGHHTVARNRGERDLGSTCARVMAGDVQAYLTLPPQSACPNARGRTMRPPGLYVTPILAGIDAI